MTLKNIKANQKESNLKDEVYRIYLDNKFIGLETVSENKLKRNMILQE